MGTIVWISLIGFARSVNGLSCMVPAYHNAFGGDLSLYSVPCTSLTNNFWNTKVVLKILTVTHIYVYIYICIIVCYNYNYWHIIDDPVGSGGIASSDQQKDVFKDLIVETIGAFWCVSTCFNAAAEHANPLVPLYLGHLQTGQGWSRYVVGRVADHSSTPSYNHQTDCLTFFNTEMTFRANHGQAVLG